MSEPTEQDLNLIEAKMEKIEKDSEAQENMAKKMEGVHKDFKANRTGIGIGRRHKIGWIIWKYVRRGR